MALAVARCGRLPVRKQDALCCPDFPLTNYVGTAIERFADVKVRFFSWEVSKNGKSARQLAEVIFGLSDIRLSD